MCFKTGQKEVLQYSQQEIEELQNVLLSISFELLETQPSYGKYLY